MKRYTIFYRSVFAGRVSFDFDRIELDEHQCIDDICFRRYNGFKQLEYVFEGWAEEV